MRKAVPGYYPRVVKAGSMTGVLEDTCVVAYDTYFFVGKTVPDHVVEAALKAVWEGGEQLVPIHPMFKEWTHDRASTRRSRFPIIRARCASTVSATSGSPAWTRCSRSSSR